MLSRRRDERGAALILFALTLTVLLLMVAFAVDVGAMVQRRRQAQNSSDSASLAAAAAWVSSGFNTTTATAEAKKYVEENYGIAASDAAAWGGCTDPNPLPLVPPGTQCISFDTTTNTVRVKVPPRTVEFAFAKVIGLVGQEISASANAQIQSPMGGLLLPVGVGSGSKGLKCLEGGGAGFGPKCQLASGSFGSIENPRYRSLTTGSNRDATNFAVGVDHLLKAVATPNICDYDDANSGQTNKCTSPPISGTLNNVLAKYDQANWVYAEQGNNINVLTDGLLGDKTTNGFIQGTTFVKARLKRPDTSEPSLPNPPGSVATPTYGVSGGHTINGVHVAKYMTTSQGLAKKPVFYGATDPATKHLNDAVWNAGNGEETPSCAATPDNLNCYLQDPANVALGPIFSASILSSPRFGFVPVLQPTIPNGSSGPARIVDFYAVYLDRIDVNGAGKIQGARAFIFDPDFIEVAPGTSGPGGSFVGGAFVVNLVR